MDLAEDEQQLISKLLTDVGKKNNNTRGAT